MQQSSVRLTSDMRIGADVQHTSHLTATSSIKITRNTSSELSVTRNHVGCMRKCSVAKKLQRQNRRTRVEAQTR